MPDTKPNPSPKNGSPTTTALDFRQAGDVRHVLGATDRRQSLAGFDPKFTDIVDYIIRITHEIWDHKSIGKLYDYYQGNIVIHTSSGTMYGREAVIHATIQALAGFPDRRLSGDEVIWGGDEVRGFYTSHRMTHEGTNTGHTLYGAPSGRKVQYWSIADCISRSNMIFEEWIVRDETSLIHQMGFDVHQMARAFAKAETISGFMDAPVGDPERLQGQLPPAQIPPTKTFEPENFIRRMFHNIWNWRLLDQVHTFFAPNLYAESSSGRKLHGRGDYQAYVLALLSPFPDLTLSVDNVVFIENPTGGYRVATRFTLMGTHTGVGIYGKPTGKPIRVYGMSHHLIENEQITREWTIFDEFALLKQLYAKP